MSRLPAVGQIWPQGQPRQQRKNTFSMLANPASYLTTGIAATLSSDQVPIDPDFDKVTLLLDMEGVAGSSSFVDRSNAANPITPVNGAVISSAQTKHGTGSYYNNNQSRYLEISSTPNLSFPGDFTIEVWFWAETSQSSYPTIFEIGSYTNGILFRPYHSGGGLWINGSNYGDFLNATLLPKQQWNHAAFVRSGTSFVCYLNGQVDKTATISGTINSGLGLSRIGSSTHTSGQHLNGYIDEFRVTKGLARYLEPFTPPTEPFPLQGEPEPEPEPGTDPYFANVSLLLHMDGSNGSTTFTDNSSNARTITPFGNAQISTSDPKYGTGSALFDGSGDYLTTPYLSNLYDWWSSDYTIEAWVYAGSWATWSVMGTDTMPCMVGNMMAGTVTNYWSFGPELGGRLKFYYFNGAEVHNMVTGTTLPTSQWNHIAAVKTSLGVTLYINGISSGGVFSIISNPQSSNSTPITIGSHRNREIEGRIDDLRITKGVARYNANFTPPTEPFPNS